jgi:hypothetical protein
MDRDSILTFLTSGIGMGSSLITYLIIIGSLFMIAKQEREEFAWFAFVPFLNLLLMCKLGKVNPLWLLLMFTGCLAPIVLGYLWGEIAKPRGLVFLGWLGGLSGCLLPIAAPIIALKKS